MAIEWTKTARDAILAVLEQNGQPMTVAEVAEQAATILPTSTRTIKSTITRLHDRRLIARSTSQPYRYTVAPEAEAEAQTEPEALGIRLGPYLINRAHGWTLIDIEKPGMISVYTPIMEIDRETKLPRSKRLIFSEGGDPALYRQALEVVAQLSGSEPTPDQVAEYTQKIAQAEAERDSAAAERDAAMQLAGEAEAKLNKLRAALSS